MKQWLMRHLKGAIADAKGKLYLLEENPSAVGVAEKLETVKERIEALETCIRLLKRIELSPWMTKE